MENTIALAELVGAGLGSLCLAALLGWLSLYGLMRLMPARTARAVNSAHVGPANRKLLPVSHLELQG